jgi:uncharacterized membrane protein
MTFAGLTMPGSGGSSRWLLLGSLALNLFFIGIGGALLLQQSGTDTTGTPGAADRSLASRIERIAATLPREDGDRLRAAYRAQRDGIDGTRADYRAKRDAMRAALRTQPFDKAALQAVMAEARAARQAFDRRIQDFFAQVASEMTQAGRQKLADWPGSRRRPEQNSQTAGTKP